MDRAEQETVCQPFFAKVQIAGIRQECPNYLPNAMCYWPGWRFMPESPSRFLAVWTVPWWLAAKEACGDRAVAVTAVSLSLASGELEQAQQIAALIGIRHVVLRTEEFANESYLANPANRCYFCKTELYSRLESRLSELVRT